MQTWHEAIGAEKQQPYFQHIIHSVHNERAAGQIVYPPAADVFNAFRATEFGRVRVVILGQDPYHGANQAHSHAALGWETFTDHVIAVLNEGREHLVFMLWGSHAQKKGAIIDRTRHLVLTAPHPSPLSAHRGFFGCRHFSQANAYLQQHGLPPIDWQI